MREQLAKLSRGHDLAKAFSLARMRIALIFGLLKAHELQQYNKILTFHVNSLPSFVLGPRTGGHGGPSDQDRLLVAPRTTGDLSYFWLHIRFITTSNNCCFKSALPVSRVRTGPPAFLKNHNRSLAVAPVWISPYIERGLRAVAAIIKTAPDAPLVGTSGDHSLEKWKWQKMLSFSNVVSACHVLPCQSLEDRYRSNQAPDRRQGGLGSESRKSLGQV